MKPSEKTAPSRRLFRAVRQTEAQMRLSRLVSMAACSRSLPARRRLRRCRARCALELRYGYGRVSSHTNSARSRDVCQLRWNAAEMGPCRDVAGEIRKACEDNGLAFCGSSHRAEHYFFMNMGRTIDSDVNDEEYRDFYGPAYLCTELSDTAVFHTLEDVFSPAKPSEEWLCDWLVKTCELIDKCRPMILYFDTWIQNEAFKPYLKKVCAYYYNRAEEWGKEVTINYKHNAFPPTVATFDVERGALTDISPVPWQTDTAIGRKSWGYITDNEFKPSRQIICDLVDIVSKNGMLLINVGPKPDGTITDEETAVLEEIGVK